MQTAAESDSLLLGNLFGFWSWFTWFMPFLNPAEEKAEADISASSIAAAITASTPEDIRLQKEFYAQMVFTGIHMPFEGSERDITRHFAWVPEGKALCRAFVAEYPLIPIAYQCVAMRESAVDDILAFLRNFHMFEGAIIKLFDFSPEEWIAHHYHEHLCKAIESDPLAIQAIEQLEILTTEQIRGLYYHIINGRFVN